MVIEFNDNAKDFAAFEDDPRAEFARIIRKVAGEIENGENYGVLHDYNGNRVGTWKM